MLTLPHPTLVIFDLQRLMWYPRLKWPQDSSGIPNWCLIWSFLKSLLGLGFEMLSFLAFVSFGLIVSRQYVLSINKYLWPLWEEQWRVGLQCGCLCKHELNLHLYEHYLLWHQIEKLKKILDKEIAIHLDEKFKNINPNNITDYLVTLKFESTLCGIEKFSLWCQLWGEFEIVGAFPKNLTY